jgi:hypothetical protein
MFETFLSPTTMFASKADAQALVFIFEGPHPPAVSANVAGLGGLN